MEEAPATTSSSPPWSDLVPDLLGRVVGRLPFPSDRARFRAVCRAWHAAARQHIRQLPWIVFPDCSFISTIGDDEDGTLLHRMAGLPDKKATCLGAAAHNWVALDYTDDVLRRTPYREQIRFNMEPSKATKHRHAYLLHNPFSGETVPLPQLDSILGHVPETFQIRKVLMRSSSNPDDVVAILTNSCKYNLVLCCRGKNWVPQTGLDIFDVAFLGDRMYGINLNEDLIAFDLREDDDGMPTVDKYRRVIKKPLADGEEDPWNWLDHDDTDDDDDDDDEEEEEEEKEEEEEEEEDSFDDTTDGKEITPYETDKGHIVTIRRLVTSHCDRELLMVRHEMQVPPLSDSYTRKVQVFKADINAGKWVSSSITNGAAAIGKGEALFLSRSSCTSIRAYGDIKESFIYFLDTDDVFDTNSWACKPFSLPQKTKVEVQELMTWLFPPKLVV